jgi:hypothetical protein
VPTEDKPRVAVAEVAADLLLEAIATRWLVNCSPRFRFPLQRLYRSRPLFWPVYRCVHCVLCARPTSFLLVLREAELVNRVDQCLETELLKVLGIARIQRIHGVAQQSDSQQRVKGLSWVEPG